MDRDVEAEIEANEQRGKRAREEKQPSVVDAVSAFAKPLANRRADPEDAKRQRIENDAEQRRSSELSD